MSDSLTQLEMHDDVAWLTLDDGKANALSPRMLASIDKGLDAAEKGARAIVISGRPGRFSAGFDLSVMRNGGDAVRKMVGAGGQLGLRLLSTPLPVVAACTGHAIAMGSLILLSCDSRVGAEGPFRIGLNETAIGMALPGFAVELARERLSKRHLTRATIQAQLYDPASAVDVGFLDQVVPGAQLRDAVAAEAAKLVELDGASYRASKLAIREGVLTRLRSSLASFG